jgi:tetratricopeptide (TPR) repeat protein
MVISQEPISPDNVEWNVAVDSTVAYFSIHEFATSLNWAKLSLPKIEEEFGINDTNYTIALNRTAKIYYYLGNTDSAWAYGEKALQISRNQYTKDNVELIHYLNDFAIYQAVMSHLKEAEQLMKESLEMSRRLYSGDHPNLAGSISSMAVFYFQTGDYKKAEPLFLESLAMNRRLCIGDNYYLAVNINNTAGFYKNAGKFAQADTLYREALAMLRRIYEGDNKDLATIINNLAEFYIETDDYSSAEPLLKESLEMNKRLYEGDNINIATSLNNLALNYNDINEPSKAEPLLINSLEMVRRIYLGDHEDIALALINLAQFYFKINNFEASDSLYSQSIDMYKRIFTANSAAFSETEKERYWGKLKKNFEEFLTVAIKRANDNPCISEHCYNDLLFTKAMLASSTLKVKESIINRGDSNLVNLYNKWHDLKIFISKNSNLSSAELNAKFINIDSLNKLSNNIEKELTGLSEEFKSSQKQDFYSFDRIKKLLKKNEAAIEIVRFRLFNKSFTDTVCYAALIITQEKTNNKNGQNQKVNFILLDNGNELETYYIKLYNTLLKKQKETFTDKEQINKGLKEIYQSFWQKISENLKGIKKVYLSPDGAFNQVNLNTLINPVTNRYLIDETEIHLVTSTRDIIDWGDRKSVYNNSIALFGDPLYKIDGETKIPEKETSKSYKSGYENISSVNTNQVGALKPLPGTRKEVNLTSEQFIRNKWLVKEYLSQDASEENIKKLRSPEILHIATHGKFLKDEEIKYSANIGMEQKILYQNPLLRSLLFFA